MGIEIEKKFLVNKELWVKATPQKNVMIRQAYLTTDPQCIVRVRILDDKGYITLKGETIGITRKEFEYEIPANDAEQLISSFAKSVIEKKRHYVLYNDKTWEVDEYFGANEGLLTAEIELLSPDEQFAIPEWVGKDVTSDYRYSNSNLADKPYNTW